MLLDELRRADGITLIEEKSAFNFSRLVNAGADIARGELLALINDDVVPENSEWLGEMVSHLLQPGVGAVGARLWYPDGRLQHGGVIVGLAEWRDMPIIAGLMATRAILIARYCSKIFPQ